MILETYKEGSMIPEVGRGWSLGCRRLGRACDIHAAPEEIGHIRFPWQRWPDKECVSQVVEAGKSA